MQERYSVNSVYYWYDGERNISYCGYRPYEVADGFDDWSNLMRFSSIAEARMYFLLQVEEHFGADFLPA